MIKKDYYTCRVIENVEVDKHIYLSELINENNEVIQSNMYDEASTLIQVENYKYENGQLIKTHIIDKVFDVETLTTCTYLGDKIIEEKEHFLNDTFSATKYKYNGAGKLLSISQVDETGAVLSQE